MRHWNRFILSALAVVIGVVLAGCSPSGQSQMDEEKEPHFVLAKSRVNAMDYEGALEAFQESLEVNPRSSSAHYQLACLYDTKISDPAAAIYHYQQYLKLNPDASNADVIKGRVEVCKQQLAANVLQLPSTTAAQKQLEDLAEKNRQLQLQVDKLNEMLKQWNAYAARQGVRTNPAPQNNFPAPPATSLPPDDVSTPPPPTPTPVTPPKSAKPRTYKIADGDTPAAIARKYGVKLDALLAANPGLVPTHLRVGQVLNIPSP